jgi:hypothetical protein
VSFAFPADVNDPDVIRSIRTSPNNVMLNAQRFKDQRDWFVELGLAQ